MSSSDLIDMMPDTKLFAEFMLHLPVAAYIKDASGRYEYLNQAYEQLLELAPGKGTGKWIEDLWSPEAAQLLREQDAQVLAENRPLTSLEVLTPRGKTGTQNFLITKFPLHREGLPVMVAGFAIDISAQIEAEEALRNSEQRYRMIAEYTNNWETWIGPDGEVRFVSPACQQITGHPRERFETDAAFIETILHADDLELWRTHIQQLKSGLEKAAIDYRIVQSNGRERWITQQSHRVYDDEGKPLGLRFSCQDITNRKLLELRLQHEAFHDPLTGLPNRTLCLERIARALERSKRRDAYNYAVIFLDLDRFKTINDSLGHAMGDLMLRQISQRLKESVRSLDTVSRLGGDEFVIILEELATIREAISIANRIRKNLQTPFDLDGHDVFISASLGIVLSPALYDKPEDLLRNANIAMRRAKILGRNRFKVFHSRMLDEAIQAMNMETALRRGIENNEFFILYQPIVTLANRAVTGFEALLRWRHPSMGVLPAGEFIPLAEDSGLIIPLGRMVLQEACSKMAAWQKRYPALCGLCISVNLTLKQLKHPNLCDDIASALTDSDLDPASLKLEISERVLMDNPELTVHMLTRLKTLGVKLSIDDFGANYSSLEYLRRFPIDTLKVDHRIVRKMGVETEHREIGRAVVALAHSLHLDVVAEGVEMEEQCIVLEDLQCENAQGYLFSRPVDHDKAVKYLAKKFPPDRD